MRKRENRVKHFLFRLTEAPNALFHRISTSFREGHKNSNDKMVVGNKETAMNKCPKINKETAMNKCPKIGERVKTKPTHRYGELTGTVMAIYPTHDDEWDESTDEIIPGPLRAEKDWHIGMKVDVLPPHWSYQGTDRFAPEVKELVKA